MSQRRGSRGAAAPIKATSSLRLKPRAERERSAEQIANELSRKMNAAPGHALRSCRCRRRFGSAVASPRANTSSRCRAPTRTLLYEYAPKLAHELGQVAGAEGRHHRRAAQQPRARRRNRPPTRRRAGRLGGSHRGHVVQRLRLTPGLEHLFQQQHVPVILELDPRTQREPAASASLYVRSERGALVPLTSVAQPRAEARGRSPSATPASCRPPPCRSTCGPVIRLSEAVAVAEARGHALLPERITSRFQGSAEAFQSSLSGLGSLLLIAVLVIYLVLGVLYESLIHPLTILSALPFAGFGAVVTLMIFGIDLNVYAFVGVILLVGLVKKNGIMMVDFAIDARKDASVSAEQRHHGRVLGALPPDHDDDHGGACSAPCRSRSASARVPSRGSRWVLSVVGGLLFSQLLTLYVTPVFYVYLERFREWLRPLAPSRRARAAPAGRRVVKLATPLVVVGTGASEAGRRRRRCAATPDIHALRAGRVPAAAGSACEPAHGEAARDSARGSTTAMPAGPAVANLARILVQHDADVQVTIEPNFAAAQAELKLRERRGTARDPDPLRLAVEQRGLDGNRALGRDLFEVPAGRQLDVVLTFFNGHADGRRVRVRLAAHRDWRSATATSAAAACPAGVAQTANRERGVAQAVHHARRPLRHQRQGKLPRLALRFIRRPCAELPQPTSIISPAAAIIPVPNRRVILFMPLISRAAPIVCGWRRGSTRQIVGQAHLRGKPQR